MVYSPSSIRLARTALYCLCCASMATGSPKNLVAQPVHSGLARGDRQHAALYTREDNVVFSRGAHADLLADMFVPRPSQPGATPGTSPRGAVIINPGGGYVRLATNLGGRQPADWFAAHGMIAFVLHHRLGARSFSYPPGR